MECRFDGKVVAVTGANSTSIGFHIAKAFYNDGASLSLCSRSIDRMEESKSLIDSEARTRILPVEADMSDVIQCRRFIEETVKHFGRIDVLINNAAVQYQESALDTKPESWDATYNTKARGYFFCAQAAAREMIAHGHGGSIINIGSVQAGLQRPERLSYSTVNACVEQMTRYTAYEWGPYGIRVNCVIPGSYSTGLNVKYEKDPALAKALIDKLPLRRRGKLPEMGHICEFLASDLADYITGACIPVDGGYLLVN